MFVGFREENTSTTYYYQIFENDIVDVLTNYTNIIKNFTILFSTIILIEYKIILNAKFKLNYSIFLKKIINVH